MALTETRPETDASPATQQSSTSTLDGILGSADHKTIGRMWIGSGLLMLVASLVVSVFAAFEATDLDSFAIVADADQFTQVWSLGRELLLFGAIVPIIVGLATFLVPLQIGAPAIAFARGAAGAFWTWFLATDLLIVAYLLNGGPGGGRLDFVELWTLALGVMAAALAWALVIIATTILAARTNGMTLQRVPQATWSFLIFSLVGILSLPLMITELVLVYVRVKYGFVPLEARQSLVGVATSANLAPAIYWVGVPVLGMATDIIGVQTSHPTRKHKPVMSAIGLLGILSYGADFFGFASVRPLVFDNGLLVVAIAAGVLPILAVLGMVGESYRKGKPSFNAALIGALVSGLVLLVGALTSLLGLIEPIALFLERQTSISINLNKLLILNGTTFHDGIRGLVVGAAVVGIIAALHNWAPKIWGRRMSESLGMLSILVSAGGAVVWGLGAVLAGVDDQPDYPVATLVGGANVEFFNLIAAVGIAMLTAGAAIAALNAAQAAFGKGKLASDPWTGSTLEWATSSPPSVGNFDKPPSVRSATPLADTIDAVDESEIAIDDAARADSDAESEGSS